ncbi:hypothetical protein F5Y19DRAFT_110926 [Xylariaceae sp. FL1651]|nr:hypothetical protein F5Y19DRAFT_110926 [Xylariaceae sp. FL1651]
MVVRINSLANIEGNIKYYKIFPISLLNGIELNTYMTLILMLVARKVIQLAIMPFSKCDKFYKVFVFSTAQAIPFTLRIEQFALVIFLINPPATAAANYLISYGITIE